MLAKDEQGATEARLKAEAFADATLADPLKLLGRARVDTQPDYALVLHELSDLLIQEPNLDTLYNRILDAAIALPGV